MARTRRSPWWLATAFLGTALALAGRAPAAAETTITIWSHEADEPAKVAWREKAARNFEAKHPDARVKITWYDKPALNAALRTALRAGQGPDIFYAEPDQTEYITNGFAQPLDDLVNWGNIYDWARGVWTVNGKTYGLPQEAYTIELYYNKDLMRKLGVTLPPNGQVGQAQFLDIVKKASAAITPISQGVGDRPYPGAYMAEEALLRKLGRDDYGKLLAGKLSYKDPRVVEALTFVKALVDAGAYPKSFATLKLGESHYYFHTKPGALMFPMGSFYTGRAFVPPDKGGQPENFPLGVMAFPAMDRGACNHCKTLTIGASFILNAASKNTKLAAAMLNEMATPEMGTLWLETVLLQTAIKSDASKVGGRYAAYFRELLDRNRDAEYFIGIPRDHLEGKCRDTFTQVLNNAFPGGLLTVNAAVDMLNQGCYTG
ncbi:MAG TPA: extracellular solute-binding protein [Methylomirabilota bacterium]|nr:extracellular solute-binding protein [Methylomirabilota bacterium]